MEEDWEVLRSVDSKIDEGARSPRCGRGEGLVEGLRLRKSAARGSNGGGCFLRRKNSKRVRR